MQAYTVALVVPSRLSLARCLLLWGLLLGVCAGAFWAMDAYTDPQHAIPASAATGSAPEHPGSGRVFVFLIDSLRYETAIDPAIMPATEALRSRGTWAKTLSSRDAVTVPALRAAFTGRERFTVFGFIKNLWYGEEGFTSLFTQLEEAGRRTAIFSDGSFKQFGGGPLLEKLPNDLVRVRSLEADSQVAQVLAALQAFQSGRYDLVISHVTFADHEAHRVGIHHPDYAASFRRADGLVRMLDEAIPPEDTFVVFGDHGHDEMGRHMMGLDVPTFTVCRGPACRPGLDLGLIPIMDLRYLLGYFLELPLPSDYGAGRHPEALVSIGPVPEPYARSYDLLPDLGREGGGVMRRHLAAYWATVFALAALTGAWAALAAGPPRRRALQLAAAVFAATLLLVAWGWLLASVRPSFHYPRFAFWIPGVFGAIVAGIPLALRYGAVRTSWGLFAIGGVLFYPTVYRYGAPGTMAPVWMALLLYVMIERRRADWNALAAIALLLPFAVVQSDVAQFARWYGALAQMIFRGDGIGGTLALGVAGAIAAKLVIFVRRGARPVTTIAGVAVALALSAVEVACLQPREPGSARWLWAGAIAGSGLAWWALRRRRDDPDRDILVRMAAMATLTLAFYYSVRVQGQMYLWLDWLLAALVLSGRSLRPGGAPARLLLLVCGTWAAGWAGLAWTFHRVEWGFLYDWIDAGFVEDNSGLFIAAIVGRYLIPMIMVRVVLSDTMGGEHPQRAATLLAGLKTLSIAAMTVGIGLHVFGDDVYLEGVQETAIWGLLSAALIFSPAARPEATARAG